MKRILNIFGIIVIISLFFSNSVKAGNYTYEQCISDCNAQVGNASSCVEQCRQFSSEVDFLPEGTTACGLLGCNFVGLDITRFDNLTAAGVVQLVVSLIFVGIIAYGIFLVIKASLTIIRSEGNPDKIQGGSNMIKAVFIGIGIIFVGIVGLVLVLAFFDATGIVTVNPEEPAGVDLPII